MGDPMVQTLLGMVPKVHELTWTNCGHFTRSRSHEEGISRARSSLERANLKDSRYFMFFDPFIHKGPFDGSLSFSLVSTDTNPSIISSKQGKQVRTNQEGGSLHDNEPDEMASLGQTNLSSKPLEESGYDATQTISAINQDETSDPTIFPAGTTSEQGDMGDPMVQTLLGMVPKVHELTWTNCGHFTHPKSHEEGISRARPSLVQANLKDSRYFMFFDPFIHKGPFDGSLSFSLVSTDANPSIISSRSCYWARPLRKAKGGLLDDW
ncbi:hypothetical protein HID58_070449, partial [Brassica napus]